MSENRFARVPILIPYQSPMGKDEDNEVCFWYACMVCICTCMQASRHVDQRLLLFEQGKETQKNISPSRQTCCFDHD
jgi:hypothetical protein